MTTFIQLHLLTSYPPANLNRDDLGRPKTAIMGGIQRLRISSQSLKRAWRTSNVFQECLCGYSGIRTKRFGAYILQALLTGEDLTNLLKKPFEDLNENNRTPGCLTEKQAKQLAWSIAAAFVDKPRKNSGTSSEERVEEDFDEEKAAKSGKKKESKSNVDKKTLSSEQLVFYATDEIKAINRMIQQIRKDGAIPNEKAIRGLVRNDHSDADIALFGRMLAASPRNNTEAAAQVAHALSVHKVAVEDDYFTAVDDLNKGEEDMGAGHIGETEFAAGLFYQYICIDRDLLLENLQDDEDLTKKTLRAFTEATATIAPTGKQNSFASRAYASFILAEKGKKQPRSLSVAFLKPIPDKSADMMADAIAALKATRDNMDKVYGPLSDVEPCIMNAATGDGSLKTILDFVSNPLPGDYR